MTDSLSQTVVTKITTISKNAWLLEFKCTQPFLAGQVLGVTTSEHIPPRLYSIASGQTEMHKSIFFNMKKNGDLTPELARLEPGSALYVSLPHGSFTSDKQPSWWIGTGTGVAPFRSMLRSEYKPQKMIQGARTENELYFEKEFSQISDYVSCLTRQERLGQPTMRLSNYLAQLQELPSTVRYYLCGNTNMVVDVRELLLERGIPFENIVTEIYF